MRITLAAMFATLTSLFQGIGKFANAFNELGSWAEAEAKGFREEADEERAMKLAERRAARKALEQQ